MSRLRDLLRRALLMELRVYESLARFVGRRPKIAEGAEGFRYHRPVLTILIVFIVLSGVEIPIIDFIVHRWTPIRVGFLILGIWGLTWMFGLLCAYLTRPHTVGPEGIRVREGLETDLLVPWDDFASIRPHHTVAPTGDPQDKPRRVFEEDGEPVCAIRIGNETNLEIALEGPTRIVLPGRPPRGGAHEVTRIRFWADAPEDVLGAVRRQLELLDAG